MPGKNFNDLSHTTLVIAILFGLWGTILSFVKRERKKYSILNAIMTFMKDMLTNMGFTLLTYFGLIGYGINEVLAVAVAGFVGYQGTRAMYLIEILIADKLGSKAMMDEVKKDV